MRSLETSAANCGQPVYGPSGCARRSSLPTATPCESMGRLVLTLTSRLRRSSRRAALDARELFSCSPALLAVSISRLESRAPVPTSCFCFANNDDATSSNSPPPQEPGASRRICSSRRERRALTRISHFALHNLSRFDLRASHLDASTF